jgi:hypothetical protein
MYKRDRGRLPDTAGGLAGGPKAIGPGRPHAGRRARAFFIIAFAGPIVRPIAGHEDRPKEGTPTYVRGIFYFRPIAGSLGSLKDSLREWPCRDVGRVARGAGQGST